MFPIEFHPDARAELREAVAWYRQQKDGLGQELLEEISNHITLITKNPEIWPEYLEQFHRIILKQFPYHIVYRIRGEIIEVIAVAHQKRRPDYWRKRTFS